MRVAEEKKNGIQLRSERVASKT